MTLSYCDGKKHPIAFIFDTVRTLFHLQGVRNLATETSRLLILVVLTPLQLSYNLLLSNTFAINVTMNFTSILFTFPGCH